MVIAMLARPPIHCDRLANVKTATQARPPIQAQVLLGDAGQAKAARAAGRGGTRVTDSDRSGRPHYGHAQARRARPWFDS